MKRGNSRGAKDPCRIDVSVRRKEYRLGIPTTELCSEPRQGLGPGPSSPGRLSRCRILIRGLAAHLCMLASETIR